MREEDEEVARFGWMFLEQVPPAGESGGDVRWRWEG